MADTRKIVRPLSPHLQIYRPQLTSVLSILHRATGIALTPRQAEIALLILRGHSSASAALALGLSPQTVKVFRRQIHARCSVTSQAGLFALLMPHLGQP